ncbi:MAG TPA: hypothetical protein VI935_08340 [Thermodesulfobacteriota bacterium]|nr:hypothetical protein [Thermodesulfobacteriota bacterium]
MPEISKDEESCYFSYFKILYESWERSMSKAMGVWFHNPIFTCSTIKAIEKSVEFKDYIYDIMDRTLKHRFIPAMHDMDKLVKSLDKLEVKVNKVEEKINKIQSTKKLTTELKKGAQKKGGRNDE